MTTAGGAYYATAVTLRAEANKARTSYPEALARLKEARARPVGAQLEPAVHACGLLLQAVGYEVAAALCCVAQAIEDGVPDVVRAEEPPEPPEPPR